MIMAVPSTTSSFAPALPTAQNGNDRLTNPNGRNGFDLLGAGRTEGFVQPKVAAIIGHMFRMTRSSLRGYQELSSLCAQPQLKTMLDVIARQRSAQCSALARMAGGLICDPVDPDVDRPNDRGLELTADDLEVLWTRAIWNFEQGILGRFCEYLDLSELALEDAFLNAANEVTDPVVAANFQQFAVDICGARQCLEEVTAASTPASRY